MDECIFQQLFAKKENPSRPFMVMGKFDVVLESNTKIIPATFHIIKGTLTKNP